MNFLTGNEMLQVCQKVADPFFPSIIAFGGVQFRVEVFTYQHCSSHDRPLRLRDEWKQHASATSVYDFIIY